MVWLNMPASPLPRNGRSEKLWFEYDAYAKLENTITFLITDLSVFHDYLEQNPAPLPQSLVEQFAEDLQDFKKDAEELKGHFGFQEGEDLALDLWNLIDPRTHKTIGQLIAAHQFSKLSEALEQWTKDQITSSWQEKLKPLGTSVSSKMDALLKAINENSRF